MDEFLRRYPHLSAPQRISRFQRLHSVIKEIEPWGILLAVVGLFLSLIALGFEYVDKVEERTVRAWQLVTTKAPGNSGKAEALEYLNRRVGLCIGSNCLLALKDQTPLTGIDLSKGEGQPRVYLRGADLDGANFFEANLAGADLRGASLRGASLRDAVLDGADLSDANLAEADLTRANLNGASLNGAILHAADLAAVKLRKADLAMADLFDAELMGADLFEANLQGASLVGATLYGANLQGAKLRGASFEGANLEGGVYDDKYGLRRACGDETTKTPDGLTIPMCANVGWYSDLHHTHRHQ